MRYGPAPPPAVGQLVALLPDGSPDPAAATDCGEACVSSVLRAIRGLDLSPGCIRQSMGKAQSDGRTTGEDLRSFLQLTGIRSRVQSASGAYKAGVTRPLHRGRYVILLGYWDGPGFLHWVVGYGAHPHGLWVMDPWPGRHTFIPWSDVTQLGEGTIVHVRP